MISDKKSQPSITESSANIFSINNRSKIIILSLIVFFASQKLYFKALYQINFPFGMDFPNGVNYVFTYVKTGVFPFAELFAPISGHIHMFPRLIAFPNIFFNSFDVANLFYLHWGLESIALVVIFLLLRRTGPKLYWLLIPVSAFIYSPLQDSNYWSFAIMLWLLPPVAIMGMIYLLNKGSNLKFLSSAIGLAIVSTFSVTIGIVAWLVGIFALIKFDPHHKKWIEKKFLSIWVASTVIIGLIFYSQFSINDTQPNFAFLFTFDGFSFLATFISSAFRLKYHFLMVLVGSASLILGSYCVYYFTIKKNNLKIALPWILFLIVGVGGALITDLGRGSLPLHYGNEPYYIPISHFFQIGLLVLISLIIIDLKKTPRHTRNNILVYFLLAIIIAHMILLVPSYYAGWSRGEHYYELKTDYVNCYSLSPKLDCIKPNTEINGVITYEAHDLINYWIENKLSIFGDATFNQKNLEHLSYFEENWNKNDETNTGIGKIELINGIPVSGKTTIYLDNPMIIISGWALDEDGNQLDSTFLLVDDNPFIKFDNFQPRKDVLENFDGKADLHSGWEIFFMSGYLENDCQSISIAGFNNDKNITLNQEIEICKNNMN
tara:strand:- start:1233 stop:3050 length:1818 start_codon:yes stop_codon:yes gene_type:complete